MPEATRIANPTWTPGKLASGLLLLIAVAITYVGIAVLVSVAGSSISVIGGLGIAFYASCALGLPIFVAVLVRRQRGLNWWTTVGVGAGGYVIINLLLLLPVAIVSMAM
jgi:hypothetical protein